MNTLETIRQLVGRKSFNLELREPSAVVVICLLDREEGIDVLFEVRAAHLNRQPGEVCLPGGGMEDGETPREAAIREASEELLVDPAQVELLGSLGETDGPGTFRVEVFAAVLHGYNGTYSPLEVDHTFTVPLDWFLEHEPDVYTMNLKPQMPADFPWDLIPGHDAYPFRGPDQKLCFYAGTDPFIWGFTARIICAFARALRSA